MKDCCKNQTTPYCPQCGAKLDNNPLKSLLSFLRKSEKATKDRRRHLKWEEWADAVEAALANNQFRAHDEVFQALRGERTVVVPLDQATEKLPAGLYRVVNGVLTLIGTV